MKLYKLVILQILFSFLLYACTDEKDYDGYPEDGDSSGIVPGVQEPTGLVAFRDTLVGVLKSEEMVRIPVVVSEKLKDTLWVGVEMTAVDGVVGKDFSVTGMACVPKDSLMGYVEVTLTDDAKVDNRMAFILTLAGVQGNPAPAKLGDAIRCHVIVENNALISFQKTSYSTWEAAESLTIPFRVIGTLTGATQVTVAVKESEHPNAAREEGENVSGNFRIAEKTVTLEAGATEGAIVVEMVDDKEVNESRFFDLRIADITGGNGRVGTMDTVCRVTIQSEEIAKVVVFPELAYTVDEDVKGQQLRIPVAMDMVADEAVVVQLITEDGSAVAGTHYQLETQEVTINAGETQAFALLTITNDKGINEDRDFRLKITAVTGGNASLGNVSVCQVTIVNDDYGVTFGQETYEFTENATGKTIRLTSSKTLETPVTLTLEIESGATAVKGTHFDLPLEVTLPAGEVYIDVPLTLIPDPYVTGDKEFGLKIIRASGAGAILPETACTVTIKETDVRKTINFASAEYIVREDDGTADIVVRLDDRLPEDVTIAVSGYNTAYCSGPAAVTIPGGQTSATLTLNLTDDQSFNADREVTLSLGVITYGNMTAADVVLGAQNTCKVIIANDDLPEWNATVPAYTLEEASGEQQITITLKQAYDADITVYLSPSGATFGTELAEITPVTIPAGQTSVNVTVNMMANPLKEPSIFALQVTRVNNSTYDTPVTVANITPTACLYRRLLGKWKLSSDSPEAMNLDCEIIISSGENGADFNKRLVCTTTGKLCTNSTATFKWCMEYDPSTRKIKVVMGERINVEDGFALNGRAIYMTWNYYGNAAVKYIETTLQDENTLLWNSGGSFVCIAYIAKDNNDWLGQGGWHLNNVKMKR